MVTINFGKFDCLFCSTLFPRPMAYVEAPFKIRIVRPTEQAAMNSWPKSRQPRDVGALQTAPIGVIHRTYIGPVTSALSDKKQQIRGRLALWKREQRKKSGARTRELVEHIPHRPSALGIGSRASTGKIATQGFCYNRDPYICKCWSGSAARLVLSYAHHRLVVSDWKYKHQSLTGRSVSRQGASSTLLFCPCPCFKVLPIVPSLCVFRFHYSSDKGQVFP